MLAKLAPVFLSDKTTDFVHTIKSLLPETEEQNSRPETNSLLLEANDLLYALENETAAVFRHLQDLYSRRLPELPSLNLTTFDYARTVLAIGTEMDIKGIDLSFLAPSTVIVLSTSATTTTGRPLTPHEHADTEEAAHTLVAMHLAKIALLAFVSERMALIAPNVSAIVGTAVASLLVGSAGSIAALARIPAGNIQVLGSEKRALAGFSAAHAQHHVGHIAQSDLVLNTAPENRTKARRLVAAKVALAARVDAARHAVNGAIGLSYRSEIVAKLEKLAEPAPERPARPIPPPPLQSTKKRGGKRARKLKEQYAQTETRKLQNRVAFGQAEEEIVVGASVKGMGMLSGGSGRVKLPPMDMKLREHVKKQSQKAYGGLSAKLEGSSKNL